MKEKGIKNKVGTALLIATIAGITIFSCGVFATEDTNVVPTTTQVEQKTDRKSLKHEKRKAKRELASGDIMKKAKKANGEESGEKLEKCKEKMQRKNNKSSNEKESIARPEKKIQKKLESGDVAPEGKVMKAKKQKAEVSGESVEKRNTKKKTVQEKTESVA